MASFNFANILTKSIGIAGLGLIAVDAHHAGMHDAKVFSKEGKAQNLESHYFDDMKLDSNSVVKAELKKKVFAYHLDEGLSSFFTSIKGYAEGFSSILVNNLIPLGLSIATVATKGKVSKFFGAGLLAYGGIFLAQEVLGIGKSHE